MLWTWRLSILTKVKSVKKLFFQKKFLHFLKSFRKKNQDVFFFIFCNFHRIYVIFSDCLWYLKFVLFSYFQVPMTSMHSLLVVASPDFKPLLAKLLKYEPSLGWTTKMQQKFHTDKRQDYKTIIVYYEPIAKLKGNIFSWKLLVSPVYKPLLVIHENFKYC